VSHRRPFALIALAAIATTLGLSALPAAAAQVSVPEYVKSICTAISDFQVTIGDAQASVESQVAELSDVPSAKSAYVSFMEEFVTAVDQLRTDLKAAGTPQIENGGKLAGVLRSGIARMHAIAEGARDDASDPPTRSPAVFTKALTKISTSMDKASEQLGKSISKAAEKYDTGEFDEASENEPACAVIGGGSNAG
jgi:hypothetical protein